MNFLIFNTVYNHTEHPIVWKVAEKRVGETEFLFVKLSSTLIDHEKKLSPD